MSTLFARRVIVSYQCVKIYVITCKEGREVPACMRQFEVKDEKILEAVRNPVQVAVLGGDKRIDNLVAISFYDSRLVYFYQR